MSPLNTSTEPNRCESCAFWLSPRMGRGWCREVENHAAEMGHGLTTLGPRAADGMSPVETGFDFSCPGWQQRKGAPKKREDQR